MGSSKGARRDAEMTDDGWGSGDFDAEKILADDGRRWNSSDNGGNTHEFDEGQAVLSRHGAVRKIIMGKTFPKGLWSAKAGVRALSERRTPERVQLNGGLSYR